MESNYQYKPVRYYLLTFALSWIPLLLAIPLSKQENTQGYAALLQLLGLLGPATAALWLIFGSGNQALKDDFKDRLKNFRRWNPPFLLVTFLFPLAMILIAISLSLLIGESPGQFRVDPEVMGSLLPLIILGLILAPVFEEIGWRGYGVDALRARMGLFRSSLVYGVLWSLWHAPLAFIAGNYLHELVQMSPVFVANFFISLIPAAILSNWLYYKHGRSITAAIVLHSMLNAAAMILSTGQPAKTIATGVYVVALLVIWRLDRESFAEGKRNFIE